MAGALLKFDVILAGPPGGDDIERSVGIGPGVLAMWEMSGPVREAGASRRSMRDFDDDDIRMTDVTWLVWCALGRPADSFEDWLPNFLGLGGEDDDSEDDDAEGGDDPDPTVR